MQENEANIEKFENDEDMFNKELSPSQAKSPSPVKISPQSKTTSLKQSPCPDAFTLEIQPVKNDDKIHINLSLDQESIEEDKQQIEDSPPIDQQKNQLKKKLHYDDVVVAIDSTHSDQDLDEEPIQELNQEKTSYFEEEQNSKQVRDFEDVVPTDQNEVQYTARKPRTSVLPLRAEEFKETDEQLQVIEKNRVPELTDLLVNQKFALIGNPVCQRLFFIIRIMGCILMVANVGTEMAYLINHSFASTTIFALYLATFVLKLGIICIVLFTTIIFKVIGKEPKAYSYETDQEERNKNNLVYRNKGLQLYSAIALSYWSGAHRVLTAKSFVREVGIGFGLDIFFTLAFLFLQAVNNANLVETTGYQKYFQISCMILKAAVIFDLSIELAMLLFEVYKKRQLSQKGIDLTVQINEERRRQLFSARYFKFATFSLLLTAIICTALSATLPSSVCDFLQGLDYGKICTDCKVTDCLECSQSGPQRCDFCKDSTFWSENLGKCDQCETTSNILSCKHCINRNQCVDCFNGFKLINGKCLPCQTEFCASCDTDQDTCAECEKGYFLSEGLCKPCLGVCKECISAEQCTACDENKSTLNKLLGICECKQESNWILDLNNPKNCVCNSDYITSDGKCSNCTQLISDCLECSNIYNTTNTNTVINLPFPPPIERPEQAPFALCANCGFGKFFNQNSKQCTTCKLWEMGQGCQNCDQNGNCNQCAYGMYLKANSSEGCGSCSERFSNCQQCTQAQCLKCNKRYFKLAITSNCYPKFW